MGKSKPSIRDQVNRDPQSSANRYRRFLWCVLAIGASAFAAEAARLGAVRLAISARDHLESGRAGVALEASHHALKLHPYEVAAKYTQLVALKRLGRWSDLAGTAEATVRWYPEAETPHFLAGEAWYQLSAMEKAAPHFWIGLQLDPAPKRSPTTIYYSAMLAGERAWGPADPRVVAAALQSLVFIDEDRDLPAGMHETVRMEAARVIQAAGAPLAAAAIRGVIPHGPAAPGSTHQNEVTPD